jgi:Pyruvate phosphate dikinase, AMP/ATP-binding domain
MVRSDLAAAGVMFSIDTETGFRDAVLTNASYGLGENVVQGSVNPDEYYVFKPALKQGFRPILQKMVGTKEFKLVYDVGGSRMTKNVPVPPEDRARFAVNDDEILELARWACLIQDHYCAKRGRPTPMDMEWAKDGRTGELFIVQARPETVQSQKKPDAIEVRQAPVLRGQAGAGRRDDRRCVLSQGCDRPAERLQDQRICQPCGRPPLRAGRGEPHAGLPRRFALLRPALPGRLRSGMPRHEKGARRDGADEREALGAVLPDRCGGPARHRRQAPRPYSRRAA